MAYLCKDKIENGMQGLMYRKFSNANGSFLGWTDFSKEMNGLGFCQLVTGEKYAGNWANNKYAGQGKLTFANGDEYTGSFVEGRRDGFGRYQKGESYYEGEWKKDRWHGKGKLYENGTLYEGEWKNGDLKTGTATYSNGDRYTGSLKKITDKKTGNVQRLPDGNGIMIKSDGIKFDGLWKNGEPVPEKIKVEKPNTIGK
ncbi:MAG: hypothetical protein LBR13_06020 [Dysgonamonadaceae bacterium]|nr:hypothetical protein [Dysgonamonadaceae bacterium]